MLPVLARAAVATGEAAAPVARAAAADATIAPAARRVTVIPNWVHGAAPPPIPEAPKDPREKLRLYEHLWNLSGTWDLFERLSAKASKFLKGFTGGITVTVKGGPNADIRRVWYLALSAAFGRYRNRVIDRLAEITYQGIWDITSKACRVEIVYNTSNWNLFLFGSGIAAWDIKGEIDWSAAGGFIKGAIPLIRPGGSGASVIQRGPEQLTIGGGLPSFLKNTKFATTPITPLAPIVPAAGCNRDGGRAATLLSYPIGTRLPPGTVLREWPTGRGGGLFAAYPYAVVGARNAAGALVTFKAPGVIIGDGGDITLPDDGRIITSGDKRDSSVQPPQPPVDGILRTNLLALVSQALSTPCFLPSAAPCTPNLTGGSGRQLWPPGTFQATDDAVAADPKPSSLAIQRAQGILGPAATDPQGDGSDGYPVQPALIPNFSQP